MRYAFAFRLFAPLFTPLFTLVFALLFTLLLNGCALLSSPTVPPPAAPQNQQTPAQPAVMPVPKPAPSLAAKVYTNTAELIGQPFRDLGQVSGDSCQMTAQDPPPSVALARKRMQINTTAMQGNAVLQHRCEIMSGTPGCYRQAVCLGSALFLTR